MRRGGLILGLFLIALPARAGNCPPAVPPAPPPVPEVTISRSACAYLLQQAARESVDYQAGVDSEGRAVVPADLPDESQLKLPTTITAEIAPALAHWLPNQSTPYDTLNLSRINLGTISLTGGVLTFNGQPLGASHQDDLLALCKMPPKK